MALVLAAVLAVAALGSLLWRGMPGVDFDERMLRPRDSRAMAAFDKVREVFPQWGTDALRLMVEAPDDESMKRLLAEAERRISDKPGDRFGGHAGPVVAGCIAPGGKPG